MDSTTLLVLAAFVVFLVIAVGAAVFLWVAMPVTITGLRAYLKKSIEEQEKTNRLIKELLDHRQHVKDTIDEAPPRPERRDNVH